MEIYKNFNDIQKGLRDTTKGFVPTMGNLHEGHLTLVRRAFEENDQVIVSIYVNPLQFGIGEDFQDYPRTFEQDLNLLNTIANSYPGKSLVIFHPLKEEDIFIDPNNKEVVDIKPISRIIEGKKRPGHFQGVGTIVKRLFEIIDPTRAYFGKKDYQQVVLIQNLVKEYNLKVEIIPIETVRETSGLAMSSRNNYLSHDERKLGLKLKKSLDQLAKDLTCKDEALDVFNVERSQFLKDPNWDYLELRDQSNLRPPTKETKSAVLLGCYKVGKVRLLDNLEITWR